MTPLRPRPTWWDWELELSVHAEQRMHERGITEIVLRAMLERAQSLRDDHVEGRFLVSSTHAGRTWEIILEPDADLECIVVVTVYSLEKR